MSKQKELPLHKSEYFYFTLRTYLKKKMEEDAALLKQMTDMEEHLIDCIIDNCKSADRYKEGQCKQFCQNWEFAD